MLLESELDAAHAVLAEHGESAFKGGEGADLDRVFGKSQLRRDEPAGEREGKKRPAMKFHVVPPILVCDPSVHARLLWCRTHGFRDEVGLDPLPQAQNAIRWNEDDDKKDEADERVEALGSHDVDREGLEQYIDDGAD